MDESKMTYNMIINNIKNKKKVLYDNISPKIRKQLKNNGYYIIKKDGKHMVCMDKPLTNIDKILMKLMNVNNLQFKFNELTTRELNKLKKKAIVYKYNNNWIVQEQTKFELQFFNGNIKDMLAKNYEFGNYYLISGVKLKYKPYGNIKKFYSKRGYYLFVKEGRIPYESKGSYLDHYYFFIKEKKGEDSANCKDKIL